MLCPIPYRTTLLYHAIENTVNQNTGKPLCIQHYYSHLTFPPCAVVCCIDCVGHCIFYGMVYKIDMQLSLSLSLSLSMPQIISLVTWIRSVHTCVYRENFSDSWDIPPNTTQKCCITSTNVAYTFILYTCTQNSCKQHCKMNAISLLSDAGKSTIGGHVM